MPADTLSNAPLVEAILEMRWKLSEPSPGVAVDPGYKLLVGRLHERVSPEYPFHEPLPSASMPDEMLGHVVQHRFRKAEGAWPLVQVGPGIATLNQTAEYVWDDFEKRGLALQRWLLEAYPGAADAPEFTGLRLRYIDSVPFDFEQANILAFLSANLKIEMGFAAGLLDGLPVESTPIGLNSALMLPTTEPKGALLLRFSRGLREDAPALVWETVVQSENPHVPSIPDGFAPWLSAAHALTHELFGRMIEGPLKEQFR